MNPQINPLHEIFRDSGSLAQVGADRFFLMNGAEYAWYILKGSVDVFSVRLIEGRAEGARSFFFDCNQGELIFGISNAVSSSGRGLVVVPASGTELIRVSMSKMKELFLQEHYLPALAPMLEHWLGHLSLGISRNINPRTDQLLEEKVTTSLDANLKIRTKKGVVWIEFLKGNALFLDMKEVVKPDLHHIFPVSQDSWLQTMEVCEIHTLGTLEACHRENIWQSLNNFYEVILYCDFFNNRLFSVDEFNRLNEKAAQKTTVRNTALLKIATALHDRLHRSAIFSGHDPMFEACRLVAEASGISITSPSHSKDEEGSPLTLNDVLRFSRFRARKVSCSGLWWKHDNGPLLAFTREGGLPVALLPVKQGKYEYINPAKNFRTIIHDQNASLIAGEAYQFYRPFPDKAITGLELIRFGLKSCQHDLFLSVLAGLLGGLLTLVVPIFTGLVFDEVIPRSDHRQLAVLMLVILAGAFSVTAFQIIRSFMMIRIETRLDFTLQSAIWDRLLNLPIPFFRDYQAGELAAKANSIQVLRKILSETVIYSVLGSAFLLVNLVMLFYYDFRLTLLILIIMAGAMSLLLFTGLKIRKEQAKIISLQNRIFGKLIQFLSNISKIKIAGAEVHAFAQWANVFSENKKAAFRVRNLSMTIILLSNALPVAILLVVFLVIAKQLPDTLSTGDFIAFYTAMAVSIAAFLQLIQAGVAFFMATPYLGNLKPILETLPENAVIKPEIQQLSGEIEVSNVGFRYHDDTPLVLRNISMHILPGEFVAIVGASGSGKSTLLRLLLGFETPTSGSVYYDRQDISSIDPASVRRQTGTVLQQSQLAAGNILSNIAGMTNATFEDAWEAARNVGLDEDIRQMPMGMYTVVTGGLSTLSGGQRQRIMIARAIVAKPRILFFDEATSALDNNTQEIVNQSLEKLQATRVIIAHRLSTIMNADKIYFMENGRITECGTYSELMDKGGKFAELVHRQQIETDR